MLQKMRKHVRSRSAPWLIVHLILACGFLVLAIGSPGDPRVWRTAFIVLAALLLVAVLTYGLLRRRGGLASDPDEE